MYNGDSNIFAVQEGVADLLLFIYDDDCILYFFKDGMCVYGFFLFYILTLRFFYFFIFNWRAIFCACKYFLRMSEFFVLVWYIKILKYI